MPGLFNPIFLPKGDLKSKNTNKHLRLERHRLQTADATKVYKSTHINHGIDGGKHIFIRNAKRYRPYVKE